MLGCILGLIPNEDGGVSSLTPSIISHHKMGCLKKGSMKIPDESGAAMCFMRHSVTGQASFLVGTNSGALLSYNLQAGRISQIVMEQP
jgi:hypothetical protein